MTDIQKLRQVVEIQIVPEVTCDIKLGITYPDIQKVESSGDDRLTEITLEDGTVLEISTYSPETGVREMRIAVFRTEETNS